VEVWDPRAGPAPVRTLGLPQPPGAPPRGLCTAVLPCPAASAVLVGYEDGCVYVLDVGSGAVCCRLPLSKQPGEAPSGLWWSSAPRACGGDMSPAHPHTHPMR
jgi:hypothetical protein